MARSSDEEKQPTVEFEVARLISSKPEVEVISYQGLINGPGKRAYTV